MKCISIFAFIPFLYITSQAQLSVRYDPSVQPTDAMQYFKPVGSNSFGLIEDMFRITEISFVSLAMPINILPFFPDLI